MTARALDPCDRVRVRVRGLGKGESEIRDLEPAYYLPFADRR